MPDPKLEALRADLREVFRKHDVAGIVVAGSPTHIIFSMNLEASWNCIELGADQIRFNSMRFPVEQREQMVKQTANFVVGMEHAAEYLQEQMEHCVRLLGSKFQIKSTIKMERRDRHGS